MKIYFHSDFWSWSPSLELYENLFSLRVLKSVPHGLSIQSGIKRFVHTQDISRLLTFIHHFSQEAARECVPSKGDSKPRKGGDLGSLRQKEAEGIIRMLVVWSWGIWSQQISLWQVYAGAEFRNFRRKVWYVYIWEGPGDWWSGRT